LYVPEIKKVQQAFGKGGKTFVCDCKAASLDTRAYLANTMDYYLCPLPETQISAEKRRDMLQPVWQDQQTLQQVYRPAEDGDPEELVAEGFSLDVPLQAEVDGKLIRWTERRWLVRSLAHAAGQHKQLDRRLHKAQEQLEQLNERKQGKKRLTAEELQAAAEAIVTKQRVQGMLNPQVQTTTRQKKVRGYGDRPACVLKEQEHRLEVSRDEEVIEQEQREMGWRVYATNQLALNLAGVVWGYRGQNRLEDNCSPPGARTKGTASRAHADVFAIREPNRRSGAVAEPGVAATERAGMDGEEEAARKPGDAERAIRRAGRQTGEETECRAAAQSVQGN
jgi:transposase